MIDLCMTFYCFLRKNVEFCGMSFALIANHLVTMYRPLRLHVFTVLAAEVEVVLRQRA